ncbi:prenyltransferase [Amycolatopsis sp. YIM 10]|uniref:prenyltransferase n=1 Tax=Amycolatopsis sp. YIM 10 TaxID=2653857 RepID=UPI00129060AC|nr:prenyltransferase [Amycolatopsis sp. YIM 10]QFU91661.1 hypothetical protein YIM_32500 [Amycolatopsis sp. YIM 10]
MIDFTATADFIVTVQQNDGAIPWFADGPLDPWDHVEAAMGLDAAGLHGAAAAAYRWLARTQNPDGSWFAEYRAGTPSDRGRDANFTAYIAVGALHHHLSTNDTSFLGELWPTIDNAIEFALSLQQDDGTIRWRYHPDGRLADETLLTGCCSIHHALRSASTIAGELGAPRPHWQAAQQRLADAITGAPHLFLPKPLAMDWYYPILGGIVREEAARTRLAQDWSRFVEPGFGVRCVDHEPWITGGETAELALTLAVAGEPDTANTLLRNLIRLRTANGAYWTGYNYRTDTIWPEEQTTWTAGAILLAHAAINAHKPTLRTFGPETVPVNESNC